MAKIERNPDPRQLATKAELAKLLAISKTAVAYAVRNNQVSTWTTAGGTVLVSIDDAKKRFALASARGRPRGT